MTTTSELGVSAHHEGQLLSFLKMSRAQRQLRLKSVVYNFDSLIKSRLNDTTYTKDELIGMIKELRTVVEADVQNELINAAHMSLLLMRQLCAQAEQWQLALHVNLAQLEDRELLDAVYEFEEARLRGTQAAAPQRAVHLLKKLPPVELAPNAQQVLDTEIGRLRSENAELRKILGSQAPTIVQKVVDENKLADIEATLSSLKQCMTSDSTKIKKEATTLQAKLNEAQDRLLEMQAQLHSTEKELEKKFSQTGAYKNMKMMLTKKNKQIKDMRARLHKYEPQDNSDEEVSE